MNFSSIFQSLKFREAEEAVQSETTTAVKDGGTIRREVVYAGTPSMALKQAAVFAAVRILSESAASCMLKYQRWSKPLESYVDCEDSMTFRRMYYLLTIRPNRYLTAFQFFKNLYMQKLLYGNAYVYRKHADTDDEELFLCTPGTVTHDVWTNTYTIRDTYNQIADTVTGDEILHFKDFSLDGGRTGISRIHFAAIQLNIAATATKETLDRFATGGSGKFIYHNNDSVEGGSFSQSYDDEELLANGNDIQDQLNEGRDVLVIRGDGKLEPLTLSAADQQFLSSQEFNVLEIARFFGVPPQKLFQKGDQTYKSVDAANISLYNEGLKPLMQEVQNEFNAKLVTWTMASTMRFQYDLSPLYLTDKITEADYMTKRIQSGTLTVNEARSQMNLCPVKGGDEPVLSTNMAGLTNDKISGNNKPADNNDNNNDEDNE